MTTAIELVLYYKDKIWSYIEINRPEIERLIHENLDRNMRAKLAQTFEIQQKKTNWPSESEKEAFKKEWIDSEIALPKNQVALKKQYEDQLNHLLDENAPEYLLDYYLENMQVRERYLRAEENIPAAKIFYERKMPEEGFNDYLALRPSKTSRVPSITIEGHTIDPTYSRYYFTKLEANDPRIAVIGKYTDCCMFLGHGHGGPYTIDGIESVDGGFYAILKRSADPLKPDQIISQAWVLISDDGIILNSVESERGLDKTMISDFYTKASAILVSTGIKEVVVGYDGSAKTPPMLGTFKSLHQLKPRRRSDESSEQRVVANQMLPLEWIYTHDHPSSKLNVAAPELLTIKQIDLFCEYCAISNKPNQIQIMLPYAEKLGLTELDLQTRVRRTTQWLDLLTKIDESYKLWKSDSQAGFQGVLKSRREEIQELITHGVDLSQTIGNFCRNIAEFAVIAEDFDLVEFLVAHGVELNQANQFTHESLCTLASSKMLKFLCEHGADGSLAYIIDHYYISPLIKSAYVKKSDMTQYLMGKYAEKYQTDEQPSLALLTALDAKNWDVVAFLLEKKANICPFFELKNYHDFFEEPADVLRILVSYQSYADCTHQDFVNVAAIYVASQNRQMDRIFPKILQNLNIADKSRLCFSLAMAKKMN